MNLERQVISLKLSKRLKELGVKQESYFWWVFRSIGKSDPEWILSDNSPEYWDDGDGVVVVDSHRAFTVAELGEILPATITRQEE